MSLLPVLTEGRTEGRFSSALQSFPRASCVPLLTRKGTVLSPGTKQLLNPRHSPLRTRWHWQWHWQQGYYEEILPPLAPKSLPWLTVSAPLGQKGHFVAPGVEGVVDPQARRERGVHAARGHASWDHQGSAPPLRQVLVSGPGYLVPGTRYSSCSSHGGISSSCSSRGRICAPVCEPEGGKSLQWNARSWQSEPREIWLWPERARAGEAWQVRRLAADSAHPAYHPCLSLSGLHWSEWVPPLTLTWPCPLQEVADPGA